MHKVLLAIAAMAVVGSATATAQQSDSSTSRAGLPPDVAREVVRSWNDLPAMRASGPTEIASGEEIRGDVVVRRGPLTIAGHVRGSVVAINADVVLRPSARIDGDLLIVGGAVVGGTSDSTHVAGRMRVYAAGLEYRDEGTGIIGVDSSAGGSEPWLGARRSDDESWANPLRVAEAGPYNRVEGLPIALGPAANQSFPWGSVRASAAVVLKTAPSNGVGHDVQSALRFGHDDAIDVGGRLFNIVSATEPWQLSDLEEGLASFVYHRDYRDYFARHGGDGFLALRHGDEALLTSTLSDERWTSRDATDAFTLFHNGTDWRQNPSVDEGRMHILGVTGRVDTRSNPIDPWTGWYLIGNVERGSGHMDYFAPTSEPRLIAADSGMVYTRGFLDLRRYNRLSPSVQINLRVLMAGWLGGDELPVERRVSAEGPSELPGFNFRQEPTTATDVATCSLAGHDVPGLPAECDRMALTQLEYRNETFCSSSWWSTLAQTIRAASSSCALTWVVFADAGRGWMVGPRSGTMTYSAGTLPSLSTFRDDVGGGLDFGILGIYVAKSVSAHPEPANFFLRLQRRF